MMALARRLFIDSPVRGEPVRELKRSLGRCPARRATEFTRIPFGPTFFERPLLYVVNAAFAVAFRSKNRRLRVHGHRNAPIRAQPTSSGIAQHALKEPPMPGSSGRLLPGCHQHVRH